MVDVVVREDSEHGPEDLLPDGGGVRGQISKDGGLDVPTPVEVLRTSAARNDAGAFGAAGCDEAFHALALLLRDQRSDARGRVERVAHPERPGEVRNGVDDLVVPGPWREDATAEVAGLPVVEQARPRESTDRLCQVRIVQHDGGALPPSSRVTGRRSRPQISPMARSAAVEPLNATLFTSGWATR